MIFKQAIVEPNLQIERFKQDFPDARHVTLQWDVPAEDLSGETEIFTDQGYKTAQSDVLVLSGGIAESAAPEGITIRPLESEADWQKATELQGIIGIAEGHPADAYLPYIKTRMEVCRKQVASGLATWLGAFDGDKLAGDLGIYADARTARYQAVETRDSYRRRGICAALVTAGAKWARSLYPDTTLVIVAEPDSAAGRIYRRAGFELQEKLVSFYRGV